MLAVLHPYPKLTRFPPASSHFHITLCTLRPLSFSLLVLLSHPKPSMIQSNLLAIFTLQLSLPALDCSRCFCWSVHYNYNKNIPLNHTLENGLGAPAFLNCLHFIISSVSHSLSSLSLPCHMSSVTRVFFLPQFS